MAYRTRTYIAADFDNQDDVDAVEQLRKWNDSNYWSLSFTDAHDLQSSRDSSLYCSIKSSLKDRIMVISCLSVYLFFWRLSKNLIYLSMGKDCNATSEQLYTF